MMVLTLVVYAAIIYFVANLIHGTKKSGMFYDNIDKAKEEVALGNFDKSREYLKRAGVHASGKRQVGYIDELMAVLDGKR